MATGIGGGGGVGRVVWGPLAAALALALLNGVSDTSAESGRTRPDSLIGRSAPDLELPVLKEETDAQGAKVNRITDEKARLASFRGRKAVVLFLSSYT
jgi:hypothetical protein